MQAFIFIVLVYERRLTAVLIARLTDEILSTAQAYSAKGQNHYKSMMIFFGRPHQCSNISKQNSASIFRATESGTVDAEQSGKKEYFGHIRRLRGLRIKYLLHDVKIPKTTSFRKTAVLKF
jgi:hypothetical protein